MKVRNLNSSSAKTRRLIKNTFLEMLPEKGEISKISVSDLVKRAEISRATFYSHFDDIYSVVEEFETEIIDEFFTNAKLLATNDYEKFFKELFRFMSENDANYKMMCRADDFLFSAKKLVALATNKLLELINADKNITNRHFIEMDISIFMEGLLCEYIKYCRGMTGVTLSELYNFSLHWYEKFMKERCI